MPPPPAYCVHLSKEIVVTMGLLFQRFKTGKVLLHREKYDEKKVENTALS